MHEIGKLAIDGRTQQVSIWVMAKKPEKIEDRWRTQVLVRCIREGNRPLVNRPLVVLLDNRAQKVGRARTDTRGLFSCMLNLPSPGEYFVAAMLEDTDLQAGEWVTVPAEKAKPEPKTPEDLHVTIMGTRGHYELAISVTDKEGKFIPHTPVGLIRNGEKMNLWTDEDGIFSYLVPPGDSHIRIMAGGTQNLIWEGTLPGPERFEPEPSPAFVPGELPAC